MIISIAEVNVLTEPQLKIVERAINTANDIIRKKYTAKLHLKLRRGQFEFLFTESRAVIEAFLDACRQSGWTVTEYTSDTQGEFILLYESNQP